MFSSFLCLRKEWEFYTLAVNLSVLLHCSHWEMCGCELNFLRAFKIQKSSDLNRSVLRTDVHGKRTILFYFFNAVYIWCTSEYLCIWIYITCPISGQADKNIRLVLCVPSSWDIEATSERVCLALQCHLLVQSSWNWEKVLCYFISLKLAGHLPLEHWLVQPLEKLIWKGL